MHACRQAEPACRETTDGRADGWCPTAAVVAGGLVLDSGRRGAILQEGIGERVSADWARGPRTWACIARTRALDWEGGHRDIEHGPGRRARGGMPLDDEGKHETTRRRGQKSRGDTYMYQSVGKKTSGAADGRQALSTPGTHALATGVRRRWPASLRTLSFAARRPV
jgi:hypothetical protein